MTLNRPGVMNALHKPAHFELHEVFNAFAADPDQWVAIVTGAGDRAFCAGNDLKWQAAGGERGWNSSGFGGLTTRFDCDKPIIAAVNGVAMGGGFEIALACDLIIASENAVFALPEPRVGLAALAGGLHRLPRQIGLKRAMGMILTGRHVSAREGLDLGFVNEVVPAGEALSCSGALGRPDLPEQPDVDPRVETGGDEGIECQSPRSHGRAARISGGTRHDRLGRLRRRSEGFCGEAATTLAGQIVRRVLPSCYPASKRRQASTKTCAPVTMSASSVFSLQ